MTPHNIQGVYISVNYSGTLATSGLGNPGSLELESGEDRV